MDGETSTFISLEPSKNNLTGLVRNQIVDEEALIPGLKVIGYLPGPNEWADFLSLVLQVLASLFIVSGIIFFFAFNWAEMHKFMKLGLLAAAIIAATGLAYWRGMDRMSGKVALAVAAVLAGGLLAVYGQIYQTGADSYGLFLYWALLIFAWVLIGRFPPLWAFWFLLLNIGIVFYWQEIVGGTDAKMYLVLFLLNSAGLLIFEIAFSRGIPWLQSRWLPRLLSLPLFASLAFPAADYLTGWTRYQEPLYTVLTILFFMVCLAALLIYSRLRLDLFILLVSAGSLIIVTNYWILHRFDFETVALLLASILVIIEAALVAIWLRHLTGGQGVKSS